MKLSDVEKFHLSGDPRAKSSDEKEYKNSIPTFETNGSIELKLLKRRRKRTTVLLSEPLVLPDSNLTEKTERRSSKLISNGGAQVSSTSRLNVPYKSVGRIVSYFKDGKKLIGSGVLVSKNTILTAAHCVYNFDREQPIAEHIEFSPGYDDDHKNNGFGSWFASSVSVPMGWKENKKPIRNQYDYALVTLNKLKGASIFDAVKMYMGVSAYPSVEEKWTLLGYPLRRPHDGKEMYQLTSPGLGYDTSFIGPRPFAVISNVTNGMSGGPWISQMNVTDRVSPIVAGITSYTRNDGRLYSPYFGKVFTEFYHKTMAQTPVHTS